MLCKLCQQDAPLVKSHIIPKSFYKLSKDRKEVSRLVSNIDGDYPKKTQTGVYDTIVCETCERLFSPWDDYAQAILLGELSNQNPLVVNGETVGYRIEEFDYHKLKLFFVSVLWRASISSHNFFSKVQTGPFEASLREAIKNNDPGDRNFFAVTLARFNTTLETVLLDPHPEKFEGINYYRFYLADYISYIKVDRRDAPVSLSDVALSPNGSLVVISRELSGSSDLRVLQDITRANSERR